MSENQSPRVTVFIPTFNRGYIIEKALASIEKSTRRDIEVLVVDDGSSDDTRQVIENWSGQSSLPVKYIYQENQGKHVAHNTAVDHARGELFLNLDSDDELLADAIAETLSVWDELDDADKQQFTGIEGLCLNEDDTLSGVEYPQDVMDADLLSIRTLAQRNGEKRWVTRVDVLKQYKYPVFPGEKHMRPSYIYNRMAHHYRTRFANIRLIRVGHQPDGICFNRRKIQLSCPRGYRQYFLEEVRDHKNYSTLNDLFHYYSRYIRYSLHSKVSLLQQVGEIPNLLLWLAALPKGCWDTFRDRARTNS